MRMGLIILCLAALLPAQAADEGAVATPALSDTNAQPAAPLPPTATVTQPKPADPRPVHRGEAERIAVITVNGTIDYGLSKAVERRIREALDAGADILVFEMDTFGGDLFAGMEISDNIDRIWPDSKGKVRTLAYVNRNAISAGAMISLACNDIVMRSGTTIGDCQAIMVDTKTQTMKEAPEKVQTGVRAYMRKFAQGNGYPESLCEAMVDPDFEVYKLHSPKDPSRPDRYVTRDELDKIPSIEREEFEIEPVVQEGKLLTMSADEAAKWDISQATVNDLDEVIEIYGTPAVTVVRYEPNWSEELVRLLTHPAFSALLMMVGLLALYMAFKTPGFGLPEGVAIACFSIIFLSKYLVGLANAWDILVFAIGVTLLAIEIFVIPGFGFVGVAGMVCILVSLVLAMQKFGLPHTPVEMGRLLKNVLVVFSSILGATVIFMVLLRFLPKTPFLNRLVLQSSEAVETGYVVGSAERRDLVGAEGVALSTLRPTGKAEIGGQVLIVVADGDFIDSGERVKVVEVSGNRVVVNKA